MKIQIKKKQIFVNKPDYLGLSISELNKIVMLCYMDKNSSIVYIKIDDIYPDIAKYVNLDFIIQIIILINNFLKEKLRK